MSRYDYRLSLNIAARGESFNALLFALMRCADTPNTEKLKEMWPDEWEELSLRYHAPGGFLEQELEPDDL